jgi:hypothetical protein
MKNLSVFKNTDKQEGSSQPDYRLVASHKDEQGNWQNETIASLWKGDQTNPNAPALTGKMSEAREYQGKQYPGWKVVADGVSRPEPAPQAATAPVNAAEDTRTAPPIAAPEYPEEEINPDDIPF